MDFTRRWNFEITRQLDTNDVKDMADPGSELGAIFADALQALVSDASLPPGGALGMVLTKASTADGDVQWEAIVFPIGVPTGGATGQVLVKTGNGDEELGWTELPAPADAAASISYAGSAGLAATDVEAALDELDTEKAAAAHTHPTSDVTGLDAALTNKVETTTSGIQLDTGTVLPSAGNEGRLFVVVP